MFEPGEVRLIDVRTEISIDCGRAHVAGYAADPTNAPAWYVNIDAVEWLTPAPVAEGSRMSFVARFLRRRLAYTYEVIEYDPGVRLVMRTAEGPFPMETTYEWVDDGPGRTRMILRNRGMPSGFSRLVAPFLGRAVRSANRRDLVRLKAIVEADCPEGGSP